jgi:hypothetical protein
MEAQFMKGGMGLDFVDFSIKQMIFSPPYYNLVL